MGKKPKMNNEGTKERSVDGDGEFNRSKRRERRQENGVLTGLTELTEFGHRPAATGASTAGGTDFTERMEPGQRCFRRAGGRRSSQAAAERLRRLEIGGTRVVVMRKKAEQNWFCSAFLRLFTPFYG
jgi:hypothetical protein